MGKKMRDITDRVTQAPDLDGSLKAFYYMMRGNRGSVIEEGGDRQRAVKAAKASKKRNRDAKKTDRRYRNHHNKR